MRLPRQIVLTDQVIDLMDERTDVAIRVGPMRASQLMARKRGVSLTYRYLSFEQGSSAVLQHLSIKGPMVRANFTSAPPNAAQWPKSAIARRAAQRLSSELDPQVTAAVEAQLQGGEASKRFDPLSIAIALAALLVSASKAAWDIYRDVKEDSKAPAPAVAERRLRIELQQTKKILTEQRDRIIAVVVESRKLPPTPDP